MSTMVDDMLKHIYGFDTTCDAWIKLKKSYASKSWTKAIQLKELQNLKKGGLSTVEYMLKIKMLTDELQSAGYGLFEDEKLMSI